jgi:hypothetical protein
MFIGSLQSKEIYMLQSVLRNKRRRWMQRKELKEFYNDEIFSNALLLKESYEIFLKDF